MSDAISDHARDEKAHSSFKSINKAIVPKSAKSPVNSPKIQATTTSQANSTKPAITTPTNGSSTSSSTGSTLSPWCQNCHTSTTPLWRRDENGQILCNACGLFLKLHGRSRPISLKTDTIKSRNRNKKEAGTTDPSDSPVQTPKVPKPRKKKVKNTQKSAAVAGAISGAADLDSAASTPLMAPVGGSTESTVGLAASAALSLATARATVTTKPVSSTLIERPTPVTLNGVNSKPNNNTSNSTSNTNGSTVSLSTTEHLPSLLSTLEPGAATPYVSWAPSPSFNPLKSHLPSLNSPNPLAPLKDIESIPFSPLRPPVNPIKSILSENTPNSTHTTPFLQAVTSPLLLVSTAKHLQAKPPPLDKLKPLLSSGSALDQLSSAATSSPYLMATDANSRPNDKLPSISQAITISNGSTTTSDSASTSTTSGSGLSKTEEELQTRVSELELVNDLLKSRIGQLEESEAAARESESIVRKSEMMLRVQMSKLERRLERYGKRSGRSFDHFDDDDDEEEDDGANKNNYEQKGRSDLRLDEAHHRTYVAPPPSERKPEPSSVMMILQPDKTEPLKKKAKNSLT